MIKISYPLLYYQLNEEAILGLLVGTDYQVIEKNLKGVKTTLSNYLQRQYKKDDYYPYMEITEPKLRIIDIKIRPSYKERTGQYPLRDVVSVPVAVVYGETEEDHFECYLPDFDESFYYYEARQFRSLVQHFASELLNQLNPEALYQHMMQPPPQLDVVTLKVNENRQTKNKTTSYKRKYETLSRLTVPYPYPKSQRRRQNVFPEAAWEREGKVQLAIEKIMHNRANLMLVGNHGVGKSAVLIQAIKKINSEMQRTGGKKTFWQLMPQRITASSKYLGEWEETCEGMIEELKSANGVLWVLDIVRLIQIGGSGAEDSVAAFLMSFLQTGVLQIVGEVTKNELESMRRQLPGFVESFQIIEIEELPEKGIQKIIEQLAAYSENNLKIKIQEDALALMYRLLRRYYPYESFPGKAIKFLSKCIGEAELNQQTVITKNQVVENFVKQTGLPELFLKDNLLLDQHELENHFNQHIIGQPKAVGELCSIVKIFKAGLNNPYKPIQTLIFAGPTGVGKTASAKALADYFFGKGQKRTPLIRIDMSEFQHPAQITRFIGSGRKVGKLIQDIRERPFSVLLLDEVEKADPSIFDALMTVLDEGMLVDAFGRGTNFRNTIIIMTTNLGAGNRKSIGFGDASGDSAKYNAAINNFFRPEFVNRIDRVVYFNALRKADIEKICVKELNDLKKREGFVKRKLKLKFEQNAIDHLSMIGFDEKYGARPLQRALEQEIVSPLAAWLLENPKVENVVLKIDFEKKLVIDI